MQPVKIIVIGAGDRGTTYATYAEKYPGKAQVVGVAEPRNNYRDVFSKKHNIPAANVFSDWKELVGREKFADAVFITTQDSMHKDPAIAFANKGYHVLLEKPMAPNEEDCREITKAALKNNKIFVVCHILRYNKYTQSIKSIIDAGTIGDIVTIQHLEPVGYWHQAHSYVRGNWRSEKVASFMLLTKSCHDLDWLSYIVGKKWASVSSFGSLKHFRKEEKPKNAGDRCLDCDYEPNCPYSAKKIYFGRLKRRITGWPVNILTPNVTEETLHEALRTGPYGRCVYECDNDVVDHQVVNIQFENDVTVSFTMTAFNEAVYRKTYIFGTRGELFCDGRIIRYYDFLMDKTLIITPDIPEYSFMNGHGGGDFEFIKTFVEAVAKSDSGKIRSGPQETLDSHLLVFAAERSRLENCVVNF